MHIRYYPVDTVSILLKPFIAEFVVDDQVNDQRGADPNGKTRNVDKRKGPVSPEISERNKEVIFDHNSNEYVQIFNPCANHRTGWKARLQP